MEQIVRPDFTYEDFEKGRVIEWLQSIQSEYQRTQEELALVKLAKELKFEGFSRLLRAYRNDLKKLSGKAFEDGISEFADQELDLNVGSWKADESGIWRQNEKGQTVYACSHPIMPVQVLRSIDTGMVKIKLVYRKGYQTKRPWSEIIVPKSRISKAADIVALSDCGISVTSGERAQALVDYLRDVLDNNQDIIPEVKSVSRMGWNEDGFSPYVPGVVFDSADSFRGTYRAIEQVGSFDVWLEEAKSCRAASTAARIILAASFASVLVEPLGCLPFFVHLWGMDSGTGKTVGQMLGASVWANPTVGQSFFQTFRGTSVGFEMMAGFLHSIPLFLDDLQLTKDKHGNVAFNVYELASGSGKLRSNKSLGLNYIPTWSNCFITSGETPLVGETDGAGAVNRVIEIECKASEKVIPDGHGTACVLKENYGWAGRKFVELLSGPDAKEKAEALYNDFFTACTRSDTTDKQAMAAAVILTADALATEWIFQDGRALSVEEIGEFLKSSASVSLADRGYELLCDWVTVNVNRMQGPKETGDCYGLLDGGVAYIIRSVFNRVCAENAINAKALLSHLRSRGLIITGSKGYTKTKYIGSGQSPNCVWLKMPDQEEAGDEVEDDDDFL